MMAPLLNSNPLDSNTVFGLLKKGSQLSVSQADKLEAKLKSKPDDAEARIQLLSFYAKRPQGVDIAAIKLARIKHILWVIENDPKDGFGLFRVATGVYRIHCQGDDLADAEAFRRVAELWTNQIHKNASDASIRREAIDAIQYCDPELAENLLLESHNQAGLGILYGTAVLGISGQSYLSNDPEASLTTLRQSNFAEKARGILEAATDQELISAAARTLLSDGAILWADGKLDWDYTDLGRKLLAKAETNDPYSFMLKTLSTALPNRGERPPPVIRVGGNIASANLTKHPSPNYPIAARNQGIQGTVRLSVLIGLDGRVLSLKPEQGPPELIPSALDTVRQWEYRPIILNGKPCFVITAIDVNYTLQ